MELKRSIPKRGRGSGAYSATNAHRKTILKHKSKPKYSTFTDDLKESARYLIKTEKYSPELIAAHWENLGIKGVSHETIYLWIWNAKLSKHKKYVGDQLLYRELRHGRSRRKRGNHKASRGTIKDRTPIEERPKELLF